MSCQLLSQNHPLSFATYTHDQTWPSLAAQAKNNNSCFSRAVLPLTARGLVQWHNTLNGVDWCPLSFCTFSCRVVYIFIRTVVAQCSFVSKPHCSFKGKHTDVLWGFPPLTQSTLSKFSSKLLNTSTEAKIQWAYHHCVTLDHVFLSSVHTDIVFLIYLYQRWIYPVDLKRVNEFGLTGETIKNAEKGGSTEPQQEETKALGNASGNNDGSVVSDKKNDWTLMPNSPTFEQVVVVTHCNLC